MRKGFGFLTLAAVVVTFCSRARAEEGMFMFSRLDKLPWAKLKRSGLTLDEQGLRDLEPAVVQVAGHGTGSFVSPQGLIVTNHHVAYGCIAALDGMKEHQGIMEKGYLAQSRDKELPCPGYYVLVVRKISDVTSQVLSVVRPKMSPHKRYLAVLEKMRRMEAECEKAGGPSTVCEVKPANGGAVYTLSVYDRLRDIRLVYAPPKALGKFGGDVDNWRYPRHTADYTFLRAYVGRDGKPAPFSAKNVPYRPKRYLQVSTRGIRRGDLVLVLGFPGHTERHSTAFQAEYFRRRVVPFKHTFFQAVSQALPQKGLSGRRYQALQWALNNAVKYYGDLAKQFDRVGVLEIRRRRQAVWAQRLHTDPALAQWRNLLDQMKKYYDPVMRQGQRALVAAYMSRWICRSLQTAVDIVRWSRQKKIPDFRRELERYRNKNMYRVYDASDKLEELTTLEGEAKILAALMSAAADLPKNQELKTLVWFRKWQDRELKRLKAKARRRKLPFGKLFAKVVGLEPTGNDTVDAAMLLLAKSKVYAGLPASPRAARRARALRRKMFKWSYGRIRRSRDPLVQLAVHLVEEQRALRRGPLAGFVEVFLPVLWPTLVNKVIKPPYYDANFTARLSYGYVRDYTESATGKRWRYVSRLTWLIRKDRGKEPFIVPERLKRIYARRDFGQWVDPVIHDVPVNFTATLDTTGGNSGSPVVDGHGRLVGLLFDGTPESIVSDWHYMATEQRSICVDIRFVLFLADKFDHARNILSELGVHVAGPAGH